MGQKVVQETRRFDDNRGETKAMRSKENAHDYRYFPEPDILQVNFTDEQLDTIKNSLPELPEQRVKRYVDSYGLSENDAKILVNSKILSDFFDTAVNTYNNPKSICNFINGELMRRINLGEITLENLPFTAEEFAKLVEMGDTEKISKNDAKDVFREMSEKGGDPEKIAKDKGLLITNDLGKVAEVIDKVLGENEKAVNQYKGGDMKVFGFIMGQCTKALKGVCTPKVIKEELEKKLKSL
jgi:aspartyl-tRNA(Asn)/glutamyl-tRNA(Gln) amidotransferase subunit B